LQFAYQHQNLTLNFGNVHRLQGFQIDAGDELVVLVKDMDVLRPVVAKPPDKHITATPDFAHNPAVLPASHRLGKFGSAKQKARRAFARRAFASRR
jgi:hypothetical protein